MLQSTWPFSMPIPIDIIEDPLLEALGIELHVLRLDLSHRITGGNKWFKLLYNLEKAEKQKNKTILTFGGAYSNHIAATAAACAENGIASIGIIRGELSSTESITLKRAKSQGMQLKFVDRSTYRKFRDPENWLELKEEFGEVFIIPEGGSNEEGILGCELIASLIPPEIEVIFLPVGTGATISGLIRGLKGRIKVVGIGVVNAIENQKEEIKNFIGGDFQDWERLDYSFGGYAKKDRGLEAFVSQFNKQYQVPIEPIYSGRMFYGIFDLVKQGYFTPGSKIMAIHTGGMQYLEF